MVKKEKKWEWTEKQKKAFRELKELVQKRTGVSSARSG